MAYASEGETSKASTRVGPSEIGDPCKYNLFWGANAENSEQLDGIVGESVSLFTPPELVWEKDGVEKHASFIGWYRNIQRVPQLISGQYALDDWLTRYEARKIESSAVLGNGTSAETINDFYAYYFIPTYKVTCMSDSLGFPNAYEINDVEEGDKLTEEGLEQYLPYLGASNPRVKEFLGWFDKDGKPFDFSAPITEDVTIIAKFEVEPIPDVPEPQGTPIPVSGTTGVKVTGSLSGQNIPEGADVQMVATSPSPNSYNVTMMVNGKEVHNGFGEITLYFPVGSENDGKWYTIVHRHSDGRVTFDYCVAKNAMIFTTVMDLSTFEVEEGKKEETAPPKELPDDKQNDGKDAGGAKESALAKTGDHLTWAGFAGLALAALAACGAAAFSFRKTR